MEEASIASLKQSSPQCPVCAAKCHGWRTLSNEYGRFDVVRCTKCNYAFVEPRPELNWLKQFYANYGHDGACRSLEQVTSAEREYPNSTLDAQRIVDSVVLLLSKQNIGNWKMLDVGCGYGFFSKRAIERGFQVTALELAETERSIAEELLGFAPYATAFETFDAPEGAYDAIVMSQILEHAHDVNEWLSRAAKLLRRGGVLAVALPNFQSIFRRILQHRDPYICPPAHLNFFGPTNLTLLFEKHGFQVTGMQWTTRMPTSVIAKRMAIGESIISMLPLKMLMNLIDRARLGMMITVYGIKR